MTKNKTVSASLLAPSQAVPEQDARFPYWVGATADCPMNPIHVAGIAFEKIVEHVLPAAVGTKVNRRVPHVGQILMLSRKQLDVLAAKLPLKVFRFRENAPDASGGGSGQVLDSTPVKPRVGFLVSVPTQADHDSAAKQGRPQWVQPHVTRKGDEPAANYLYCVPAINGQRSPGEVAPPPLSVTGLGYPADDDAQSDDQA